MARPADDDPDERQPLLEEGSTRQNGSGHTIQKPASIISTTRSSNFNSILIKISFLLLGDFLANADDTFTIAVYEQIASEFASSNRGAWIVLAESLIYSVFLPIYGFLGDRYGSKYPILAAYLLLIVGCVVTSVGMSFEMVVFGRVVCGIAGAGMFSMTAIVIVDNAEPRDVGLLRGYSSAVAMLGRNSGPIIGGFLTDAIGWRKTFLCEIPVAAVCFVVVGWFFRAEKKKEEQEEEQDDEDEEVSGSDTSPSDSESRSEESRDLKDPLDFWGIAIFAATINTFVLAITQVKSGTGFASPMFIVATILFAVFSGVLYWREQSVGETAFIPLSIFKWRLGAQFLIQFFWIWTYFSIVVNIPVYFARVENAPTSQTALNLLPLSISNLIGNLAAGWLIRLIKRYRIITQVAVALGTVGFFLVAFMWSGHVNIGQSLITIPIGFGCGMLLASAFVAVSMESEEARKGAIVGFFFLAQELGAMAGISGSSTLIRVIFEEGLRKRAPEDSDRSSVVDKILRDSNYAFKLSKAWQDATIGSYIKAFKIFCLVAGAVTVVIQPLILTTREIPLERSTDQDR